MDNKTDSIFFNNFVRREEDYDKYYRVFELTKDCTELEDIKRILVENGFELIDTEGGVRNTRYKYADNNRTIVKTYYCGNFEQPLTVNVSEHSFDTIAKLQGFHRSWDEITSMSPAEMQE